LLVPAARLVDPRSMSEGKHIRFTVEAGGIRARAVAFNVAHLPDGAAEGRLHATFTLELNEWQGAIEPRLVLRKLLPAEAESPVLVGEAMPGTAEWEAEVVALATASAPALQLAGVASAARVAVTAELDGVSSPTSTPALSTLASRVASTGGRTVRDRRSTGLAGTIAALVHTGESVLAVAADGPARARQLTGRLGGFAVTSWEALERDPSLADGYHHLVAVDPPLHPDQEALLTSGHPAQMAHLAWGEPELRYSRDVLERDHDLRPGLVGAYRALRDGRSAADAVGHRPAVAAGRLLAVLVELGLVTVDDGHVALVPDVAPTDLEHSLAYRHAKRRHAEGTAWLTNASATPRAA
jgi:single-stranded-DNA-specific exonuclease